MLLKLAREGLGRLVVAIDRLTRPTPVQRSPDAQRAVAQQAQSLALYQYFACPFCIKTRRAIHRLDLPIPLRDAQNDPVHRNTLAEQGGKIQVPCLRIDEAGGSRWLYESDAIIAYLEQRFDVPPSGDGTPDDHTSAADPGAGRASGGEGPAADRPAPPRRAIAMLLLLGAAPTLLAEQAAVRAYTCVENGVKTFSDAPCGGVEQRVFVGYSSPRQPSAETLPVAGASVGSGSFTGRVALKREIARSEGRISDLEKQRDAELRQLRGRLRAAAAPSDDPGWGPPANDLATESQAIATRYAEEIALETHRLEGLYEQLQATEPRPTTP